MDEPRYSKRKTALGYYVAEPRPSSEELRRFYTEKYYQETVSASYSPTYTAAEREWFAGGAAVAEHLFRRGSGRSTGRLCDAGCGEGFFAAWFLERGWQVMAMDFSRYGVESHNPSLLPHLIEGDLYETVARTLADGRAKYDLVNLSNVLEHVLDPEALLCDVRHLVADGGLLRVLVPNDFSRFQRFLVESGFTGETWFAPPEHLNYFTVESLEALLRAVGFTIESIQTTFPIELYLANRHSNYWSAREKGKDAHLARVNIDNLLLATEGVDKFIRFYEAAAAVGLGRDVLAFVRP